LSAVDAAELNAAELAGRRPRRPRHGARRRPASPDGVRELAYSVRAGDELGWGDVVALHV